MRAPSQAVGLVLLMMFASLSGCFGESQNDEVGATSLIVSNSDTLEAGMWQVMTLEATDDLAVFIPYFIQDPGSMRAQNGTVLDIKSGEKVSVNILLPW